MKIKLNLPEGYSRSIIRIVQRIMAQHNNSIVALAKAKHINIINDIANQVIQTGDISRVFSGVLRRPSLFQGVLEKINMNLSQLTEMEETIKRVGELANLSLASSKIIVSMAFLYEAIDLYNPPKILIEQALKVSISYQRFAKKQYEYALKNEFMSERVVKAVDEASNLAINYQISSETGMKMLHEFGPKDKAQDETSLMVPSETNIFSILEQDIQNSYHRDRKGDMAEVVSNSIPAKVNYYGCHLVELIYEIDNISQSRNGELIFKPTLKSELGASKLPCLVAVDEDGFAKIVDHLYFMIYEGSGYAKRLCISCEKGKLTALWRLKDLRVNFRHDVEHGDGSVKKLKKRGDAFNYLIKKPWPQNTLDWEEAQIALYKAVFDMLKMVKGKMSG